MDVSFPEKSGKDEAQNQKETVEEIDEKERLSSVKLQRERSVEEHTLLLSRYYIHELK